jgi:secreted trypsin-like serine protease
MTTHEMLNLGKVTGWGSYDEHEQPSDVPKVAELKIFNITTCLKTQPQLRRLHWAESFCAKSSDQGVCSGDSGSGLYFNIKGKKYLKGIVSSTSMWNKCPDNPAVLYSDVSKYFGFIKVS